MSEQKYYPVVIVPGIGQSKVVETDEAGSVLGTVWPLSIDKDGLMNALKGPFMKMMLFRRDAGFTDALADYAKRTMSGIATNPDGTMKRRLKAVTYPYSVAECSAEERRYIYKMAPMQNLGEVIGEENLFFFSYNSFDKPYTVAAQLHDYIAFVKEKTGSEKVNLLPLSLGGAMATAYMDAYGWEEFHRIVYFVPALQGTAIVGDTFRKNIDTDRAADIFGLLAGEKTAQTMAGLVSAMPAGMMPKIADKLIDTLLQEVFLGSGAMWAVLPPEWYPELSAKYLSDAAHTPLKAETDRFYAAETALRDTLGAFAAAGGRVFICACYDHALPAVFGSAKEYSSDGMIHIQSATLGAKAAKPGQTLSDSEIGDAAYVSPERTVDASFGAFPESTWYFHDQFHDSIAYNDTALAVALKALSDESFTGVHSDPALGQFHERQDNRKQNV